MDSLSAQDYLLKQGRERPLAYERVAPPCAQLMRCGTGPRRTTPETRDPPMSPIELTSGSWPAEKRSPHLADDAHGPGEQRGRGGVHGRVWPLAASHALRNARGGDTSTNSGEVKALSRIVQPLRSGSSGCWDPETIEGSATLSRMSWATAPAVGPEAVVWEIRQRML